MNVYDLELDIRDKILLETKANAIAVINGIENVQNSTIENNNLVSALKSDLEINKGSFFVPAILVSTNWNRNDDVFSPEETAKARFTPVNKPISWMHHNNEDDNEILGVIVSCIPVDDDYNIILDSVDLASLDKFHLAVGGLVWERYFPTYSEDIETGLKNKDLYVSMEVMFDDFGYALRENNDADIKLIERTEKNAGLSKFLRKFDGPGKVKINGRNYQIGRWLKKMTFSGMGFVDNPGNVESIPLTSDVIRANYSFAMADDNLQKFSENQENSVLILENLNKTESLDMAKENKETQVATAENTELAEKMKDMECAHTEAMRKMDEEMAALKSALAKAESEASAIKDKLASAEADAAKAKADAEAASKALAESEAKFNTSKAEFDSVAKELGDIKRKAVAVERFAELKSLNAIAGSDDEAFAKLANMSDDTYSQVKNFAEAAFKKTTEMGQSGFTKTTEQSQTDKTKLTQALEEVKTDETKADIVSTVASVAAANAGVSDDKQSNLQKFFANMLSKNNQNAKKSV